MPIFLFVHSFDLKVSPICKTGLDHTEFALDAIRTRPEPQQ